MVFAAFWQKPKAYVMRYKVLHFHRIKKKARRFKAGSILFSKRIPTGKIKKKYTTLSNVKRRLVNSCLNRNMLLI